MKELTEKMKLISSLGMQISDENDRVQELVRKELPFKKGELIDCTCDCVPKKLEFVGCNLRTTHSADGNVGFNVNLQARDPKGKMSIWGVELEVLDPRWLEFNNRIKIINKEIELQYRAWRLKKAEEKE